MNLKEIAEAIEGKVFAEYAEFQNMDLVTVYRSLCRLERLVDAFLENRQPNDIYDYGLTPIHNMLVSHIEWIEYKGFTVADVVEDYLAFRNER